MRLDELELGVEARIVGVRVDSGSSFRLSEIGLRTGQRVRVIQHAGLGGRLIALGCARIALDSGTARGIQVEEP